MIKWFWLMLWLWLLISFFMTMVISRLFILLMVRKKDLDLNWFIGIK
jgi:hypothetical protein